MLYLVFVYQVVHYVFVSTNRDVLSQLGLRSVQPVVQGLESISESAWEEQRLLQLVLPEEKQTRNKVRCISNFRTFFFFFFNAWKKFEPCPYRLYHTSPWTCRWWCPTCLWVQPSDFPDAVCHGRSELSREGCVRSSMWRRTWAASIAAASGTPDKWLRDRLVHSFTFSCEESCIRCWPTAPSVQSAVAWFPRGTRQSLYVCLKSVPPPSSSPATGAMTH